MIIASKLAQGTEQLIKEGNALVAANTPTFFDKEEAIKYGNKTFGAGNFKLYEVDSPEDHEELFREDSNTSYPTRKRLKKQVKIKEYVGDNLA